MATEKRLKAKATPDKPTFAPSINEKSKFIAKKLQRKWLEQRPINEGQQLSNNDSTTTPKMSDKISDLGQSKIDRQPDKKRLNQLYLQKSPKLSPRIAEIKAQEKEQKLNHDKQQQENQLKKFNENLILRNFKKEFNLVLTEIGLGKV